MASHIKGLNFYFSISTPTEVITTLEEIPLANNFDFIASLVSLKRLPSETNSAFKQRVMDVSVNLGGPNYEGNINNLTRAFGLSKEKALVIDLKLNSSGSSIAENPRIDILANRIILYSNYQPNGTEVIDKEIRTYDSESSGFFVSDLVTEINSSTCFSASLNSGTRPNLHSSNLVRKSSYNLVNGDLVEGSKKFYLSAERIVENSLVFKETSIFQTEVSSTPTSIGEYLIDYENGSIETFSLPSGTYEVFYHYNEFPLQIHYSLIQLYSLQDSNFVEELFEKETVDSGEDILSLPKPEGTEILHQLTMETEFLWGK